MKKVLITGINGFIGNAVKEHLKNDYIVYGIDVRGQSTDKEYIVDMKSAKLGEILMDIQPDIIMRQEGLMYLYRWHNLRWILKTAFRFFIIC